MSKKLNKWAIAATLLCASSAIFALNKSIWSVASDKVGVRYTANGKLASGHQFGFLKMYKHCDTDMLWILLSSKNKDIKSHKGEKVEIAALIDGNSALVIPLEYYQYTDVPPDFVAAVFTNTPMNAKFIDLLKSSKKVAVKVQSPTSIADMMQVPAEEFDLAGLSAARTKAYNLCKKQ
jgi:hypothetical protein